MRGVGEGDWSRQGLGRDDWLEGGNPVIISLGKGS